MNKIAAFLVMAIASTPLVAQSHHKPSAGIRDSASREHGLATTPTREQLRSASPALRTKILRNDADIPVGTAIRMKLDSALSTQESKAGDTFTGRVSEAVLVGGKPVIPVGAVVSGVIERTSEPRRIAGRPTIVLRAEDVALPSGEKIVLNAVVVDTSDRKLDVDDEGRIKGSGFNRRDAIEMTLGSGGGAAVGTIVAGAKGTLVGAGVGVAAGATKWLARRHSIEIPAGTELIFELNRPVQLQASAVHTGY